MSPAGFTGATWASSPLSYLAQPVSMAIATESAQVLYAGSAPTLGTGFFQINVLLGSAGRGADPPSRPRCCRRAGGHIDSVTPVLARGGGSLHHERRCRRRHGYRHGIVGFHRRHV